jgi:hypothetical protein
MKLPQLTTRRERKNVTTPNFPGGVSPQGCNIGCLILKAPQCLPKLIAHDIPGFILCAGSAAAECGCI